MVPIRKGERKEESWSVTTRLSIERCWERPFRILKKSTRQWMKFAISTLAAQFASDRASVRQSGAEAMGIDPARPMVLVTGGSLGAVSLNRAVASSAAVLLEHAQVVHLTGKGKIDEVRPAKPAS